MCLVHWDMKGMYSLTSLRAINPRVNQVCFVPGTMYTTWKYSKDATRGNSFLACLFEKSRQFSDEFIEVCVFNSKR